MEEKQLLSYITSSQKRIFPDDKPEESVTSGSMLANETYSLTMAYKTTGKECLPVSVRVASENLDFTVYKVGYVPVTHARSAFEEVASENRGRACIRICC